MWYILVVLVVARNIRQPCSSGRFRFENMKNIFFLLEGLLRLEIELMRKDLALPTSSSSSLSLIGDHLLMHFHAGSKFAQLSPNKT
jgi:hypothetical protein